MSDQVGEFVFESKSNSKDYRAVDDLMKVREQTTTTTDRTKRRADIIGLDLKPDPPSFGVLCAGHTFKLCITIMNVGKKPDRFRVSCEPHLMNENKLKCAYSPIRLAPGMKTSIVVTCFAMVTGHVECLIKIQSVSAKEEIHRRIIGTVVPEEQYKIIARNFRASGKSVYAEAVSGIDADLNSKEFLAEWKLSPDDVLELSRMPVVQGVYYNPVDKELVTDQGLLNVIVDSRGTLDKSIEDTEGCWKMRERVLEEKGMYTKMVIENCSHPKFGFLVARRETMRARASLARTPSSGELNRPTTPSSSIQDVHIKFSKKKV